MNIDGKNILGGLKSAEGNTTFYAVNPYTGKKIEPAFYEATQDEIDRAIKKSSEAFIVYRTLSGERRAQFLTSIADEITALGDLLIDRCVEETGLPKARIMTERARTVNQLNLFASYIKEGSWVDARIETADPNRKPLPKSDIRSMHKALGVVGVFGSSNFPLAFSVAGGDTVSALAAGCPVVVKGHPAHPGTSELVARAILNAIKKCDMPDGTFSMVHGQSTSVGLAIVRHPLISAVGFTGSYRGGKALFDEANSRPIPIPVYAEMSSTNPTFILPRIVKEKGNVIAKELAASFTLGVGQFCTNPGLVFIQNSLSANEFTESLSKHVEETPAGVMLSAGIQNNYRQGVEKLKNVKDVDVLSRGKDSESEFQGVAYVLQSSVNNFLEHHILEEEVFGPSTVTLMAEDKNQIITAAKKLGGHLTATIHGTAEDLVEFAELIPILENKVGRLIINEYPTGVEVCHSMVHGGPFPATSNSRTTSVGTSSITRFSRPVCYQNFPDVLLPDELKHSNPLGIWRLLNGERTKS